MKKWQITSYEFDLSQENFNSVHPNLVIVFADQWRGQAVRYEGDPNEKTSIIDDLCPVCSPYRASLLTGQHPRILPFLFSNDNSFLWTK